MNKWESENIENYETLYYRVHKSRIINGFPTPGAFYDINGDMSTNWGKYSTAIEARNKALKNPENNAIIKFNVGQIRNNIKHQVTHTPNDRDRSHTSVIGEKDTEARLKYLEIFDWALKLDEN